MLRCGILQSRPSRCEAAKHAGYNPDIREITLQHVPLPESAFKARDGLSDGGGGHAKPMCGDRETSGHTFVLAHRSSAHGALVEALMTMLTEKRGVAVPE